jgi:tRNA(Ile)-lysidine synthase
MPGRAGRPPAVARVLERVTGTVRRYGMLEPGQTVLVACSGGPDSLCLLHALHGLRRLFSIRVAVFHFDHRLRQGSERDLAYVKRQAQGMGVPFVARSAVDRPAPGQSVEDWARHARYTALTEAAAQAAVDAAALGHTLDDQAETVLLALARGGGLEALSGMAPVAALPPGGLRAARPLLETSRDETAAFCRALRLRPRSDPMNEDRRYLRTRVRLDALPLLERTLDRGVRTTLARSAEHLRSDAAYLEGLASDAAPIVVDVRAGEARLDAKRLSALPGPIAARVARLALRIVAAGGTWEPDPGAVHIDGVLDLARGRPGRRLDLPGDLVAERRKGYVRISRASPVSPRRKGEA